MDNERSKKGRKVLIVSLTVMLTVIICISSLLLGLFCPRKISRYLDFKPEDVTAIYVKQPVYVKLDSGRHAEFLQQLNNIKVKPYYDSFRSILYCNFYIEAKGLRYSISDLSVVVNDDTSGSKEVYNFRERITQELQDLLTAYDLYDI